MSRTKISQAGTMRLGPRVEAELGTGERVLSALGGVLVGMLALTRRGPGLAALGALGAYGVYRGVTGRCPVSRALVAGRPSAPVRARAATTIGRSPEELYQLWRDFGNVPRFMRHVAWETELVADVPGRLLAWRTPPGARLQREALRREPDRAVVLRQMIASCRKGGTIVVMGRYAGLANGRPLGIATNKALTFRMGQVHGRKYTQLALDRVQRGDLRTSHLATHAMPLDRIGEAFQLFASRDRGCMRVVLRP